LSPPCHPPARAAVSPPPVSVSASPITHHTKPQIRLPQEKISLLAEYIPLQPLELFRKEMPLKYRARPILSP